MCRNDDKIGPCHCLIDLETFGLTGKGCIADLAWIDSIHVPCLISKTNSTCLIDLPNKKVFTIETIGKGKYGCIEGGIRETETRKHLVVIKKPQEKTKELLQEALVQKVVYRSLKKGGFEKGAPNVYDIFSLQDGSVCFSMDIIRGSTLQYYIDTTIGHHLINTIIECLFHISCMLSHLETDIGMNHRDLKPSNIILQFHDPCKKVRSVNNESVILVSKFDVTFVDFGFSCIGIDEQVGVQMSESYDPADPCPKEGRDMYMFLCFIYFYIHRKLSVDLDKLFQNWLNNDKLKMTDVLKSPKNMIQSDDIIALIYAVTGSPEIYELQATPERIFTDLQKLKKSV